MLQCQTLDDVNTLKGNRVDVQFVETEDVETVEELTAEIVKFSVACLNSRATFNAGVLIAGVETDEEEGIPRVVGLTLSERYLASVHGQVANSISTSVSSKGLQGVMEPESSDRLMKMVHIGEMSISPIPSPLPSAATPSPPPPLGGSHVVVFVVVTPDWGICQNRLYALTERRKRCIFQRLEGTNCRITAPNVKKFHDQLDHASKCQERNPL